MKSPEQEFELFSVPSHATGRPEIVKGADIGSNKQKVAPNAVLLCKINPRINRVWIVTEKGNRPQIASTEWIQFSEVEGVLPNYLAYYLQQHHFRAFLAGSASGVGGSLMRVKASTLHDYPFLIPPTNEQRRIVAKIEELFSDLDAGVAALERIRANLKRYRAAVLKAAVEGRLTEGWRCKNPKTEPATKLLGRILAERRKKWEEEQLGKFAAVEKTPPKGWQEKYVEPAALNTSGLPELPDGWCWVALGSLVETGPQNGLYYPQERYGHGVPIVRIDDYQDYGSRSNIELRRVDASSEDQSAYSLCIGDLLINRVNSLSHLGKILLVDNRHVPALFESNMMRLRLGRSVCSNYIRDYLRSSQGRMRLISNAKWAVNQASINQQDVLATLVPLPPYEEQLAIASEVERLLSIIEESEFQVQVDLKRATRLRQSILKRAFEGRLVPQDPTDEPADKLLERIRQERAATNGSAGPRSRRKRAAKQQAEEDGTAS